ncbi:MAG: hypothetical protein KH354_07310, partial [Clostridiales bacterium]|nr:hypothetical protein [Clostridiales bacterium]
IKHWKIHNYIRKDTYSPTKYHDEFSRLLLDENSAYKLSKTDVENSYVTEPSTTRQRSVDDPSTQDRLGKDRIGKDKKESKKEKTSSFDKIIAQYSTDEKTVELLKEWLKVRKAKRAAMTDKAIQMNVDKLDGIAKESGMDVNAYLSEVICRGWAALYPIRQYGDKQTGKTYGANGIEIDPNGARDLDEIF